MLFGFTPIHIEIVNGDLTIPHVGQHIEGEEPIFEMSIPDF